MQTDVRIDIDFLNSILECLKKQRELLNDISSSEKSDEFIKEIDSILKEGLRILKPIQDKNELSQKSFDKLIQKWNEDISSGKMKSLVKESKNLKPEDDNIEFKWVQLVWQELRMWSSIGEIVEFNDFADICFVRGFDKIMQHYMVETLKYMGLNKNLTVL